MGVFVDLNNQNQRSERSGAETKCLGSSYSEKPPISWYGVVRSSGPVGAARNDLNTDVDLKVDDMIIWGFPVAIFHCPTTRICYKNSTISKMDQLFLDRCPQKALLFSVANTLTDVAHRLERNTQPLQSPNSNSRNVIHSSASHFNPIILAESSDNEGEQAR